MPPIGQMWNPASVMMRPPTRGGSVGPIVTGPYVGGGPSPTLPQGPMPTGPGRPDQPGTYSGAPAQTTVPAPTQGIVGPESVRATGKGPFDQPYRQNLATYAGGQFAKPGGILSFNPTDLSTFPGAPTGGGTAPVSGMPASLLDMALGGSPFSWTSPQPAQTAATPPRIGTIQDWMDWFMRNGRGLRMGAMS